MYINTKIRRHYSGSNTDDGLSTYASIHKAAMQFHPAMWISNSTFIIIAMS